MSDKFSQDPNQLPIYSHKLLPANFKAKFWRKNAKFKFEVVLTFLNLSLFIKIFFFNLQNEYAHLKKLSEASSYSCKNLKAKSLNLLRTIYEIRHDNLNSFRGFYRPHSLTTIDPTVNIKNCCFAWQYNR